MVGESFHNNPRDPIEERFARLEEQVTDISRNMFLGCAGVIVLKRYKPETQLSILGPRRGHALKKRSRAAYSDTTDPDYFQHEMRAEI